MQTRAAGLGTTTLALVFAAVLATAAVPGQDLPAVTESHGAFGFPNVSGTEIIVRHDVPRASELRTAICAGRRMPIRFVRHQTATGAADRDSPPYFDSLEGTVFQIDGQVARPEDTCFVATDSLLENAELVLVQARSEPAACTRTDRQRFAAVRDRPMRACWSIAAVQRQGVIGAVEYVRVGRDALASPIVVTDDRVMPIDFPAKHTGGEEMWRAGDGGEFSPLGFRVPFIIRRAGTYVIAVDWGADEGNSLTLYAMEPGAPARQVINDYWYRAPR
jgi:hypothetical protein